MDLSALAGLTGVAVAGAGVVAGGAGGYAVHSLLRRRRGDRDSDELADLRDAVSKLDTAALVVPDNPDIDALAAALGLEALCKEWGVQASILAEGPLNSEDAKAFRNLFDVDLDLVSATPDAITAADGAIAVGGGGAVPSFGNNPPVVAVVRHRPAAAEYALVISRSDDGATSTTVSHLLEGDGVVPGQRVATALLYGVRAGTQEFRRVRGRNDYEAASFLHGSADHGRIEALHSPGMSSETFDVVGAAVANRERDASFAVTNVGAVPAVGALEEAPNTLLRLDGVSTAAAFGVHEETVVVSCRSEDVRTSAIEVLEAAFDDAEAVGGNADVATARIPLGLFSRLDADHGDTLDDLIDASTRKALFGAFESA